MTGIDPQYDFEPTFAQEANVDLPTGAPPGPEWQFPQEARKAALEMLTVTHLEKKHPRKTKTSRHVDRKIADA